MATKKKTRKPMTVYVVMAEHGLGDNRRHVTTEALFFKKEDAEEYVENGDKACYWANYYVTDMEVQ
jgi:hypothetical protein